MGESLGLAGGTLPYRPRVRLRKPVQAWGASRGRLANAWIPGHLYRDDALTRWPTAPTSMTFWQAIHVGRCHVVARVAKRTAIIVGR